MIYKILLSVILIVFGTLHLTRQLQMLQQNSYYASRYLKWAKQNKSVVGFGKLIFVALGVIHSPTLFAAIDTAILIFAIIVLGLNSLKANKKSIKNLVVTARVKRQFTAAVCIMVLLSVGFVVLDGATSLVFKILLLTFAFVPFVTALCVLFVMSPVEKCISQYYVNDAKKLLKSHSSLKVIGVTGSYGKTSTKFILGKILSEKYNTLITPESFNTPMGVVRTVRESLKPQTEFFVCEMGAKAKGQIKEICEIANPTMGVITSIGPQHLDTFGSVETVAATKFELADHVKANGGKMFLNADNQYVNGLKDSFNHISYAINNSDADFRAENVVYSKNGVLFDVVSKDFSVSLNARLLGLHNVLNITAAVAVAVELGLSAEEIKFAVSKLKPTAHRLEMKPFINGATLIDDAYNANPEGCLEAVRVLGNFDGYKKIIVTPGLVELGEKEYECNVALGKEAAKYCDVIILVGKKRSVALADGVNSTDFSKENLYVAESFKDALTLLQKMCDSNTAVLFENDLPDNYAG